MKITSSDFADNQMIPRQFTCQGKDINPTLAIDDIPEGTKSLVLIVDDPDAPMGNWDHWIVYNIPPSTNVISEKSVPGIECLNDFQRKSWGGPCPPSGTHRYFFKLYALDTMLQLPDKARKKDVLAAMEGHMIEKAEMVGLYKKTY